MVRGSSGDPTHDRITPFIGQVDPEPLHMLPSEAGRHGYDLHMIAANIDTTLVLCSTMITTWQAFFFAFGHAYHHVRTDSPVHGLWSVGEAILSPFLPSSHLSTNKKLASGRDRNRRRRLHRGRPLVRWRRPTPDQWQPQHLMTLSCICPKPMIIHSNQFCLQESHRSHNVRVSWMKHVERADYNWSHIRNKVAPFLKRSYQTQRKHVKKTLQHGVFV